MDQSWVRDGEGLLEVGDGQRVAWRVAWRVHGHDESVAMVVVHGGPGSGAGPNWLRLFDPDRHRVVLFDQRGCGASTPSAAEPGTDLATNTTAELVADIERLRARLGIECWTVVGGSWGATLAQAYIQAHPHRVAGAVLFAVTLTSRREIAWITEGMRRFLPEAWEQFHTAADPAPGEPLVDAYACRLADPDPQVRGDAARAWCAWEDAHAAAGARSGEPPGRRLVDADETFRYGFARLVTHYWRHNGFLPDQQLLDGARHLADIPAVLVHGTRDLSSPPDVAYDLAHAWPSAELQLVDATHTGSAVTSVARRAIERLSGTRPRL